MSDVNKFHITYDIYNCHRPHNSANVHSQGVSEICFHGPGGGGS
jgi:hypothetical protein